MPGKKKKNAQVVITTTTTSKPAAGNNSGKRRRRQRRKNNKQAAMDSGPKTLVGYKTIHNVEQSLSKMSIDKRSSKPGTNPGKVWANCRLNPWGVKISSVMPRLPDGYSASGYSYDIYSFCDINITGTQTIKIITLPCLPYSAALQATTGGTLSLSGPNAQAGQAPVTLPGAGFYNLPNQVVNPTTSFPICYGKFPALDSITESAASTYSASKARIISQSWRLVYTGTAASCQGLITVNPNPMRFEGPYTKSTGLTSFVGPLGVVGGTPINNGTSPQIIYGVPTDPFGGAASKESIQMRPETTPMGLVRRSAGSLDWNFSDILEQAALLVQTSASTTITGGNVFGLWTSSYGQAASGGSTAVLGNLDFVDPSWESTSITLSNVVGSFRFEIVTCYEFIPNPDTVLYEVSSASPPLDSNIMNNVETVARGRLAMASG